MNIKPAAICASTFIVFLAGMFLGSFSTSSSESFFSTKEIATLKKLDDTLSESFVHYEEASREEVFTGMLKGFVQGLGDPYTSYFSKSEAQQLQLSLTGEFSGIGAELASRDGRTVIVAPLKGSPAQRAGLSSGDVIASVNGTPVVGSSLMDIVEMIRGPVGTTVELGILKESTELFEAVSITRETISIPSSELTVQGNIGIISIATFSEKTVQELEGFLAEAKAQGVFGLVLDLRGNGGGIFDAAVGVMSFFLTEGPAAFLEDANGISKVPLVSKEIVTVPLAIVINAGSASASEIVAGGLQDAGRARVFGVTSFGKGSVQELIPVSSGSMIKVSVASWLTRGKRAIDGVGITPDSAVTFNATLWREENIDTQLEAATSWLAEQF